MNGISEKNCNRLNALAIAAEVGGGLRGRVELNEFRCCGGLVLALR
jgi:hypothetical protein